MAEPTEQEIRESKLDSELEKWNVLGIDPQHWMPHGGVIQLLVRHEALSDALVAAGLVTEDDLTARMQECLLERLEAIRAELQPQIQAAKLEAIKNGKLRKG